jgi:hypothetical protein
MPYNCNMKCEQMKIPILRLRHLAAFELGTEARKISKILAVPCGNSRCIYWYCELWRYYSE